MLKMSSAQLVRDQSTSLNETKCEEETWTNVFPADTSTEQNSLIFVKRLLAVGLSTVTYLRMIFPEASYKDRFVEGLNLKLLMDDSASKGANMLISWIKGCYDAIEKKYLREMTLSIYEENKDPNRALEEYTFKFTYTHKGEVVLDQVVGDASDRTGDHRKYEVRKPTFKMIRTIIMLTQSMEPLPTRYYLSMKLQYYKRTPIDYEPKGFKSSPFGNPDPDENMINLKLGDVSTPFHSVKMRVAMEESQFSLRELGDDEGNRESKKVTSPNENRRTLQMERKKNSNAQDDTVTIHRCLKRSPKLANFFLPKSPGGKSDSDTIMEKSKPKILRPLTPSPPLVHEGTEIGEENNVEVHQVPRTPSDHGAVSTQFINSLSLHTPKVRSDVSNPSSVCSLRSVSVDLAPTLSEYPVRCPCGVNSDDGIMILCDVCGYWQHAACFTILEESQAPAKHYCEQCADPPSLCTDPRLCLSDSAQVEATCLYRRALVIARHFEGNVSSLVLAQRLGVDISLGNKLLEKLMSDAVLTTGSSGRNSNMVVDKEALLNVVYPKYFSRSVERCQPENVYQHQLGCSSSQQSSQVDVTGNSISLIGKGPPSQRDSQMSVEELFSRISLPKRSEIAHSANSAVLEWREEAKPSDERGNGTGGAALLGKENTEPAGEKGKKGTKLSRRKRKLMPQNNSSYESSQSSNNRPKRSQKKTKY